MTNELTITFPNTKNAKLIREAVIIALADDDFMDDDDKVSKAIESFIPKGTLSATFKRLQKNAKRDYLDNLDDETPGYTVHNREEKIKTYIYDRFKSYMDDSKTSKKARRLFDAVYPPKPEVKAPYEAPVDKLAGSTSEVEQVPEDELVTEKKQVIEEV